MKVAMAGRLDEISRAIGSIETSVRELQRRADEDRETRDRWHAESRAAIAALTRKLDQHAAAVEYASASQLWKCPARSLRHGRRWALPASSCSVGSSRQRSNGRSTAPGRICIRGDEVLARAPHVNAGRESDEAIQASPIAHTVTRRVKSSRTFV